MDSDVNTVDRSDIIVHRTAPEESRLSMKIDERTIDHNVTRLISELNAWDLCDEDDDPLRTMALGYVTGLTDLAKALKEVLHT